MAVSRRFQSLDALRGIAILGMAWSGMLPDTLPAWMYHAQLPPPEHNFNPQVFGITWVDLIFPMFLFSMGAAIPVAINNRLERGQSPFAIVRWLIGRALLLASFSIFDQHLRPGVWSSSPDTSTWLTALGGFGLMVLMYGFTPMWSNSKIFLVLRGAAWVGAIALVASHFYPDNKLIGFANYRQDVILMVLANVAFSGAVIWLFTRKAPMVRLVIMALVGAVFLSQDVSGSVAKQIWDLTPQQFLTYNHWNDSRFFPIVYHFEYHKYLLVVIPGTLCGDLVLRAIHSQEAELSRWHLLRRLLITILGFAASIFGCITLLGRQTVMAFWGEAAVGMVLLWLTWKPGRSVERLISGMVGFGVGLLMIGLLAEPIGGGIRKDSPTLSYFLTTAGLSFIMLAALESLLDLARARRFLKFAWMTGMNPMLGYAAITNLALPMTGLTAYSTRLAASSLHDNPWGLAFADGGVRTLFVGFAACLFTRFKYFMRT